MSGFAFEAVFVTGPQGSGKGTQGKILAEKLGFLFWDMGKILREIIAAKTPLSEKVLSINRGDLLPDEVIFEIVKEEFKKIPEGKGIVFDGVPRRESQAIFLLDLLRKTHRSKFVTIFIDLPREDSLTRLLLRSEKEKRIDDTPQSIETRFRYYDELMKHTIDYLEKETTFVEIDGMPSREEVAKNIEDILEFK